MELSTWQKIDTYLWYDNHSHFELLTNRHAGWLKQSPLCAMLLRFILLLFMMIDILILFYAWANPFAQIIYFTKWGILLTTFTFMAGIFSKKNNW